MFPPAHALSTRDHPIMRIILEKDDFSSSIRGTLLHFCSMDPLEKE